MAKIYLLMKKSINIIFKSRFTANSSFAHAPFQRCGFSSNPQIPSRNRKSGNRVQFSHFSRNADQSFQCLEEPVISYHISYLYFCLSILADTSMMSPSSICSVSGVSSSLMPRPLYWNVRKCRLSCAQGDLFLL